MHLSLLSLLLLLPISSSLFIPRNQSHSLQKPKSTIPIDYLKSILKSAVSKGSLKCRECSTLVEALQQLLNDKVPEEIIDDFVKQACLTLDLEIPYVCDALVDQFMNELYFVVDQVLFTPDEICGIFLDDCGTPVNPKKILWNVTIPDGKPPVQPWPVPTNPPKTLRVLHLSDIHIDRKYQEGTEAMCWDNNTRTIFTLCCRDYPTVEGQTQSNVINTPAGKWGMLTNCDLPYITFDSAMRHIAATHTDLDYIMITGDMQAHDCWDYTKELTTTNVNNITATLLQYFPNTPIYEAVGNHEGVPQDAMAPHKMDEYETRGPQWLYSLLSTDWGNWITDEAKSDVQYRASYVLYPVPGLKLISLNTVYCSAYNFYIYLNQTDPDDTMTWLINHLSESESKGEKVHIISHIPPGVDYCLEGWTKNYYDIVNRFESTIAGQFFGHTHQDHFEVYYSNSSLSGRPSHFNFISPSLTTYNYNNPAYRIYTIDGGYDGASYTVLDAETYTTDVDEANRSGNEPQWFLEYTTKAGRVTVAPPNSSLQDTYSMPDLSPASWNDLIDRLATDDELFKIFHRNYYRADTDPDCYKTPSCRSEFICSLRSAKSYEQQTFCPQ